MTSASSGTMVLCTLCARSVDVLDCVVHAEEHIKTLVRSSCKVSYEIDYNEAEPKILIFYSPFG